MQKQAEAQKLAEARKLAEAQKEGAVMIGNLDDIEIDNFEKTNSSKFRENLRRASNNSEISGVFPMRELLGLDKALQRIEGELANNMGKLTDLDKHIVLENREVRRS